MKKDTLITIIVVTILVVDLVVYFLALSSIGCTNGGITGCPDWMIAK